MLTSESFQAHHWEKEPSEKTAESTGSKRKLQKRAKERKALHREFKSSGRSPTQAFSRALMRWGAQPDQE